MAVLITLLGTTPIDILEDAIYTDAGATATQTDGDLTGDIVTVNPVDTNIVGAYSVTYNVIGTGTDVGVHADEVVRVVNVVAKSTSENFNSGTALRDGTDVDGSVYHSTVQNALSGSETSATKSAYFSELALDPYETANSK